MPVFLADGMATPSTDMQKAIKDLETRHEEYIASDEYKLLMSYKPSEKQRKAFREERRPLRDAQLDKARLEVVVRAAELALAEAKALLLRGGEVSSSELCVLEEKLTIARADAAVAQARAELLMAEGVVKSRQKCWAEWDAQ